jgi:hypothetical protein
MEVSDESLPDYKVVTDNKVPFDFKKKKDALLPSFRMHTLFRCFLDEGRRKITETPLSK